MRNKHHSLLFPTKLRLIIVLNIALLHPNHPFGDPTARVPESNPEKNKLTIKL